MEGTSSMDFYIELVIRLLLAAALGGIIGYEREYTGRPAGFRTHILVCVASALVMLTSEFLSLHYGGASAPDPARLGASVLSGVGFLGAGTIIRDGANVRGLTTAASLWAVSCIGIAAGIGFYAGALIGSAVIFFTLVLLKRIELNVAAKNKRREERLGKATEEKE
jgi:putative Mg2+ transporter-C (MgtC) family protein